MRCKSKGKGKGKGLPPHAYGGSAQNRNLPKTPGYSALTLKSQGQ